MRTFICTMLLWMSACLQVPASEAMLTQTFQPLDGLGSDEIQIVPVICRDFYALSGLPTAIGLITAKNIPPTNASRPGEDINVASMFGIKISCDEDPSMHVVITIDCTSLQKVETLSYTEQQAIRATLECMRQVAGKRLDTMTLKSALKPAGQEKIQAIVEAFIKHPKDVPFPLQ